MRTRAARHGLLVVFVLLVGASARGAIPIVETDDATFTFGGYANVLSGVQLSAVDGIPGVAEVPDAAGISQTVARLEWKLALSDVFTFELHNRFALAVSSPASDASGGLGVGVTRTPKRSLDLQSVLLDRPGARLEHDLDRLVARLFLGDWDVAIGRQAITWGTASLFPVADGWAVASPFDLDTSQKRGIDAVRVSRPLGTAWAIEALVADRGSVDDLSGGVRLSGWLAAADVYVAAAKLWSEIAVMAGVSVPVDAWKLRAELWAAWDLDRDAVARPRATVGADWYSEDLTVSVELHYNGAGTDATDTYLTHAAGSAELARGEVYWLGRYYAGAAGQLKLTEQLRLSLAVLANLQDPSALLVTSLLYDVAESVDLTLGAFNGAGGGGDLATGRLDSELGAAGHLLFLQLRVFL